jgi:hypothetical protein
LAAYFGARQGLARLSEHGNRSGESDSNSDSLDERIHD